LIRTVKNSQFVKCRFGSRYQKGGYIPVQILTKNHRHEKSNK
jgi:hypothetical protein